MLPTSKNLYHPFRQSSLGIFLNQNSKNVSECVLEDIDLYHQPTTDPYISTIFTFIMTLLLGVGEYLHFKVFIMLKKEKNLLKDISIVFVSAQMILSPFTVFLIASTNFFHPLNQVIGQWFCNLARFVFYLLLNIVSIHSFLASLMRYLFIVHSNRVKSIGKDKVKKLFLILALLIPLIVTAWYTLNDNGVDLDVMSFINKCNGKYHKTFLIETSTLNIPQARFCAIKDFDQNDVYAQLIATLKWVSCCASGVTMLFFGANLTEVFIYFQLLSYMNR